MSKKVTFAYKPTQIDDVIGQITKDAKTLKQKIHNIAVVILMDWQDHSAAKKITDEQAMEAAKIAADRLNRLQGASPYHSAAFAKWVMLYTPLAWSDENKTWYASTSDARMPGKTYMEARENPFWEVSPPPQVKPYDMWAELQKIVTKSRKHIKDGVEGDVIDRKTVDEIARIISAHEAEQQANG